MEIFIKHNDLYGTQDVLDHVAKMQAEATSLPQYLYDVAEFIKTLGVDINYDCIPNQLGVHIKSDKSYVGWKGTISGTTMNNLKTCTNRLYGPGFKTWTSFSDKPFKHDKTQFYPLYLATAESCSGGGGDHFQYHREYIILINDFPLIKQQYNNLLSDQIQKNMQLKFDSTIDRLSTKFDRNFRHHYNELIRTSPVNKYRQKIDEAHKYIKKLQALITSEENNALNIAKEQEAFKIPEPPNAVLNLQKYTELRKKMGNTKRVLDNEEYDKTFKEIEKYFDKHIHHFI